MARDCLMVAFGVCIGLLALTFRGYSSIVATVTVDTYYKSTNTSTAPSTPEYHSNLTPFLLEVNASIDSKHGVSCVSANLMSWRLEQHPMLNVTWVPFLHDSSSTFRTMRNKAIELFHNWSYVSDIVTSTGHKWCSLYRDNHQCVGQRYQSILRQTPLFNKSFDLNHAFPVNSRVFIEGNSWMAEVVDIVVCNTDGVHVWVLDGNEGNSLYAHAPRSNVSLMLLSNVNRLNMFPQEVLSMLKDVEYVPTHVVMGSLNFLQGIAGNNSLILEHREIFTSQFPEASYLEFFGRQLPTSCASDFRDCINTTCGQNPGHTCMPGPINEFAEDFVYSIVHSPFRHLDDYAIFCADCASKLPQPNCSFADR